MLSLIKNFARIIQKEISLESENFIMKKISTLIILLVFPFITSAQITITNADLPSSGDMILFSQAPVTTTVDVTLTGPNYTWDFSALISNSQDVDTFLAVTSTPLVYILVFGLNSNQAMRGLDLSAVPGVPISDVYGFYNKSASSYKQKGYGASISGITTPIIFGNDDFIYQLPLNFNDQDSSDSDYSIVIPNLASAIGSQHRVNNVDGWGSITTPYGTFNALRIVSTLTGEDSIYLDTLGFGLTLPRPLTREYKWLATGQDIPVLQINTTETFGIEVVSLIKYRDSLRIPVALNEIDVNDVGFVLSPNPSNGHSVKANIHSAKAGKLDLEIYSLDGKLVYQESFQVKSGNQLIEIQPSEGSFETGSYIVRLSNATSAKTTKLIIQK